MFPFSEEARKKMLSEKKSPEIKPFVEPFPYNIYAYWSKYEDMDKETKAWICSAEGLIADLCHEVQLMRKELEMSLMEKPFLYIQFESYHKKEKTKEAKSILRFILHEWSVYIKHRCNIEHIFLYVPVNVRYKSVELYVVNTPAYKVRIHIDKEVVLKTNKTYIRTWNTEISQ